MTPTLPPLPSHDFSGDLALVSLFSQAPAMRYAESYATEYGAECARAAVPEGMALVPVKVVDFLCGRGPLDGKNFGDLPPEGFGPYWWRKYLAAAPTAPKPDTPPAVEARVPDRQAFERRMLAFGWRNFEGGMRGEPPCWYYDNAELTYRWIGWREAMLSAAPAPTEPQASEQKPVAYLDIGAGGYIDLGTDLNEDELFDLPKGRHMLVIAGTFGVDGYSPAPQQAQQASAQPTQAAKDVPQGEYPECSGDPYSCPENEGYGCCNGSQKQRVTVGRDCPNCKHSDSWGIPDKACCAMCAPTDDGKGANFVPLNGPYRASNTGQEKS